MLVPLFTIDGKQARDESNRFIGEERLLSEEGFLNELWKIQTRLPDIPVYKICTTFFRKVCVEAFINTTVDAIIEAESMTSSYHIDITDAEVRMEILGFDMSLGDLIEAFSIIRNTRNAYEKFMMEEIERKNKQQAQR